MSPSGAGSSRRRTKYAPRACNVCRRRKCKCDGVLPVCQPCAASGYDCSWVPEGDEDRPATKQLVEGLRAKIQFLEAQIAQLKQGATATTSSSSGGRSDAEFPYPVPQPTGPSGGASHSDTSGSPVQHALRDLSHQTSPQPHLPTQIHAGITSGSLPLSHICTPSIGEPTLGPLNEPMDTSAGRRPLLTYQYIFNIPLNEPSPEDRFSLQCEWDRHLPTLGSIQLSRYEHDTLLFRCFSYGAAWLFGLIPDLFLRDMLEFLSPDSVRSPGELQYYSPLLHCSLLAFASPLSDNLVIQQTATREKFAIHAKQWLDEEFSYGNPSLSLSLILLAEYHLGVGEVNTGYMYTGMVMRAVRSGQLLSGTGSPLGDWHCWSAFVQESLLAHEMDRPSEMPVPTVSIKLPVALELDDQPLVADSISDLLSHENYVGIALECFVHCARLMSISITIVAALGDPTRENIHLQLETWFNALPGSLIVHQVENLTPPPILALHIRYWWSILRLYPSNSAGEPSQFTHHATEKLVELFRAFDTQFGFRYFPRNLLKAMHLCGRTLILERLSENEIDVCLRGLRTWSCAGPMLSDLTQLKSSIECVNGFGTEAE